MTLLSNSSNNNAGAGGGGGTTGSNTNPVAAVVRGLAFQTLLAYVGNLFFVMERAAAGEQYMDLTQVLNAIINAMSDEDRMAPNLILAVVQHILEQALAEEIDDGKLKLTEAGRVQFGDRGPVSEAEIKKTKTLCLPPDQFWILQEVAKNGGQMQTAELEERYNAVWGVEEPADED